MGRRLPGTLTEKEELFCREYIISLNATDAYAKAGYSTRCANANAYILFKMPHIQKRIQELKEERNKRLNIEADARIRDFEIKADDVLKELTKIAFFDIRKIFDKGYVLKDVDQLDDNTAGAIAGVELSSFTTGKGEDKETEYTKKIKVADKLKALELLCKHCNLLDGDKGNEDNEEQNITIKFVKNE